MTAHPPAARPATAPAPATAERRQVTVLFIDLVGFTQFAEGRDAEDVRDVQTRYFALARETIERYGGTVEKFIGDAVMAVWGAPVAFEDDAERAVRAALDLVGAVATVDAALEARAAVVTGEAAVSVGAAGEALVTGDAVNTASRLQSAAAAGTVLVSDATRNAVRSAIAFERVDDQALKGKSLPVAAWQALRVVGRRAGAGRSEQLEPPFVGRELELRQLKDLLNTSATVRRARLVSIVGQAGVGKSRLVWELEKYVDGIVDQIYWHTGRSPSHGEGVTFWALGEMVRQRAKIAEDDDADVSRSKLMAAVDEYVADPAERALIEPRLQALLGIADAPPSGDQDELFAAWRRFFERIAERGTTVLVFEDLQWADAGVIEFVNSLLEWSRHSPMLIVTLARPELFAKHPGWGAGQLNFASIHVEPLADAEMSLLLLGLAPGLPSDAVRAVVQRAEGIPLYAVETVRMLIDSRSLVRDEQSGTYRVVADVSRPRVPESLHALVAARLDALSTAERELVQDASVIGQSFSVRSLQAFDQRDASETDRLLRELIRRDLLVRVDDPASPERGQFAFVQSVVREVAYETMSRATRRSKHVAAARQLEAQGEEELAPVLAGHYYSAYQLASGAEAEALAAQARLALRGAAERAAALHSHEQAIRFYEQALALTAEPAEQASVLEGLGGVAFAAAEVEAAIDYYRRAMAAYEEVGDRSAAIRAQVRLGNVYMFSGRPADVVELLQSLLVEAEAKGDDAISAQAAAAVGRAQMMLERSDEALPIVERSLTYAARVRDDTTLVEAMVTKGAILSTLDRVLEGVAVLAGAVEISSLLGMSQARLRAAYNLHGALFSDDPLRAGQIMREGLAHARDMGQRAWIAALGKVAVGQDIGEGRWDSALELAAELKTASRPKLEAAIIDAQVACVLAYRGDHDRAEELMANGWQLMAGMTKFDDIAFMHSMQAEVEFAAGHIREAIRATLEASEIDRFGGVNLRHAANLAMLSRDAALVEDLALRIEQAFTPTGRMLQSLYDRGDGAVAAMRGDFAQAAHLFRRAIDEQREMGMVMDVFLTDLLIVSAFGNQSDRGRAAEIEARGILEPLGASALLARLDDAVRETPLATGTAAPASMVGEVVQPLL